MKKIKISGRKVAKVASRIFIGAAVTTTVEKTFDAIGAREDMTPQEELMFHAGAVTIGLTVSDAAGKVTDEVVDLAFDAFQKNQKIDETDETVIIIDHEDNQD